MYQRKPTHPSPLKISAGCSRWRFSDLLAFEAACAGEKAPQIAPDQEHYLSAKQVAKRHGVSEATVWRRAAESRQATSR